MDAKYFDNVFQNYADDRNFIENKNSEECSVVPAGVFGLTVMEHLQGVITKKLRELELPFFLCVARFLDLSYLPTKCHLSILKGIGVMQDTRFYYYMLQ